MALSYADNELGELIVLDNGIPMQTIPNIPRPYFLFYSQSNGNYYPISNTDDIDDSYTFVKEVK